MRHRTRRPLCPSARLNVAVVLAIAGTAGPACEEEGIPYFGVVDEADTAPGVDAAVDAPPGDVPAPDAGLDADAGSDPDAPDGDYCTDDRFGTATTPLPVSDGAAAFTTALLDCSLSEAQAARCYGAAHESSVSASGDAIRITSNGIPDHDVDLFPNEGNPNAVTAQDLSWVLPLRPSRDATPTAVRYAGVASNGIKMEPETAEVYSDGGWRYEALTFVGRASGDTSRVPAGTTSLGFDCNFAHVQPNGEYHYHGVPTGLMPATETPTHVGWAADGYPIFGRWGRLDPLDSGSLVVELRGSYRVRSGTRSASDASGPTPPGAYDGTFVQDWEYVEGLGDLDACNGREEEVVVDGRPYDYVYYLTYTYPYMPRCVWGEPAAGFAFGGGPDVGPSACSDDADCVGACGAVGTGCICRDSPRDGLVCVPTCDADDDCAAGQRCADAGICIPEALP